MEARAALIRCATPRCGGQLPRSDFVPTRSPLALTARCERCKRSTIIPAGDPIAHARATDPETSHAAARTVQLTEGRELVLKAFRALGPMSDETLVSQLGDQISPSGARTRRAELVDLGLVESCGETRLASGRRATVWRARP